MSGVGTSLLSAGAKQVPSEFFFFFHIDGFNLFSQKFFCTAQLAPTPATVINYDHNQIFLHFFSRLSLSLNFLASFKKREKKKKLN